MLKRIGSLGSWLSLFKYWMFIFLISTLPAYACSPAFDSSMAAAYSLYLIWPMSLLIVFIVSIKCRKSTLKEESAFSKKKVFKYNIIMCLLLLFLGIYAVFYLLSGVDLFRVIFKIRDFLFPGYLVVLGFILAVISIFIRDGKKGKFIRFLSVASTFLSLILVYVFGMNFGGMWVSNAVDCSNPSFYEMYPHGRFPWDS